MALFPCCEESLCQDPASPVENLSAEGLDAPTFIATRWPWTNPNNPVGDDSGPPPVFKSDGCISTCESTISQEDANLCAARQAVICTGPGGGTFFSDFQAVSVSCPDGSAFIFRAAPGDFAVVSPLLKPDPNKTDDENAAAQTAANQAAQASANDQAQAYAQAQAGFHVLCLTDLPNGCLNAPYSSTVTSSCNLPPVLNFSLVSGALPDGLTLTQNTDNTAVLSGTPTSTGTFTFTIHAQDLNGNIKERTYTVGVIGFTNSPPAGTVGSAYNFQFTATGGTAPYTFFLASGSLPAGLALTSDGTISGTPTTVETDTFTVSVSDSAP